MNKKDRFLLTEYSNIFNLYRTSVKYYLDRGRCTPTFSTLKEIPYLFIYLFIIYLFIYLFIDVF